MTKHVGGRMKTFSISALLQSRVWGKGVPANMTDDNEQARKEMFFSLSHSSHGGSILKVEQTNSKAQKMTKSHSPVHKLRQE